MTIFGLPGCHPARRPRKASRALAAVVLALASGLACATTPDSPEAQPPRRIALDHTLNTRDLGGYRTVDGLFDLIQYAINEDAASITAAFDSTLGYPTDANIDYDADTADEEMGFRRTVTVTTALDNPSLLLKPQMIGHAKLHCGPRPIGELLTRRIARYLRVEFWSWW